jgi:hypothetical protein
MKQLIRAALLLAVMSASLFAGTIDGSKTPDKVPDTIALRLFLRSIALAMENPDAKVRASIDGMFAVYHFEATDAAVFKSLALKLHEAEKKNEDEFLSTSDPRKVLSIRARRKKFVADIYDQVKNNEAFKAALKEIKHCVRLDESEVND